MDAKITKQRLTRMLSYDWLKIVGLAVGLCVAWSLVFTMTATRITPTQQFKVFNYVGNYSLSADFGNLYQKAYKDNVFSYEVLEVGSENLTDEYPTVLEARLGVGEGDLLFLANAKNKEDYVTVKDENGEEQKEYYTYTQTFAKSYFSHYVYDLDGENDYFDRMENYLNPYFNGDWENGELNKEQAEKDFRARIKKDKRFKKEAQIQAALEDEFSRLTDYRDALKTFYGYLEADIIRLQPVTVTDDKGEEHTYTYYVNLNPAKPQLDEEGNAKLDEQGNILYQTTQMDGLQKYLSYSEEYINAEGKTALRATSRDMCVALIFTDILGKSYCVQEGFQGEDLLFLNYLIDAVLQSGN